ncbi:hypothetical protein B0I73DRAFT_165762 [Yarrowia lipolytica]|nr:hypothetical protein B0I73DRAFT_165762 [Yarrowia lipolytica]
MSLHNKFPYNHPRDVGVPTPSPSRNNTALLAASAAFSTLAFMVAAYSLMDTNDIQANPTRIVCCLGFFPTTIVMTRVVTLSWRSRAAFCLAVSCVNALIATIIMTLYDPLLGHVFLSLSTAGTVCYYKAHIVDIHDDQEGPCSTEDSYQAAALVFCYMACAVPLWTQIGCAHVMLIVLNCGIMYFLTVRPTIISRILALLVIILSSLYLMCTSQGPAGGLHLVFMAIAAELTIDYSKYNTLGEKKSTHDTLAFLCFICGLATLGVALNESQPREFLTVYLAVFLSLTVNAMSATRYSDKIVHMVHTVLWSWLVSVYMMNQSYHHGIIHAMLSVTTICIYSEMDLPERDSKVRETPLRYIASTVCIIAGLLTIDIWTKHVLDLVLEPDNVVMLNIMAGFFQMLFCFAPLCILDENHEGDIGHQDALLLFLGVASIQIGTGVAQVYFISYFKGIVVLALSLFSVIICWAEYVKASSPENTDAGGCEKSMV